MSASVKKTKKKNRRYNVDYLKFGFVPLKTDNRLPYCLLCGKTLSNESMKPSKLKDHLKRCHPDKTTDDFDYFQALKKHLEKDQKRQEDMSIIVVPPHQSSSSSSSSTTATSPNDDVIRTPNNPSLRLPKTDKPHIFGQKPDVEDILIKTDPWFEPFQRIPLTLERRIDDTSANGDNSFLCRHLQTNHFSIQLDEIEVAGRGEPILFAYVRYILQERIEEKFLFAKNSIPDPTGESIFNLLYDFLAEKSIPLTNVTSVATDGSSDSSDNQHFGLMTRLKRVIPEVMVIHSVIHREHLAGSRLSDRLHTSLGYAMDAVNKIKKKGPKTGLFEELFGCFVDDDDDGEDHEDEDEDEFEELVSKTDVLWLSKGAGLTRFYSVWESVLAFFDRDDPNLRDNLIRFKGDVAYLTDLMEKFKDLVDLKLQGDGLNLIKTKSIVSAFVGKLKFMRENVRRRRFCQFFNLSRIECREEDVETYVDHLMGLEEDFKRRYGDVLRMETPAWMIDPFDETEVENVRLREELIELSTNEELMVKFKKGYQKFWLQGEIAEKYPELWKVAKKVLLAFPSSKVVEKGFRRVRNLLGWAEQ